MKNFSTINEVIMEGLKNPDLFREACYINGKWEQADSGKTFSITNPFDNSVLGKVPECGRTETNRAIQAANTAWHTWKSLPAKERCDLLFAWAKLIDENKEDLARIMTLEQGKPLTEARGEIDYANGFIKWFAEEGR